MNRALFDFAPADWLPVQDKEVLERCRNIKREDMEYTNENGYSVKIVPDPRFHLIMDMLYRIMESDRLDKKFVMICPNHWVAAYEAVANMINAKRINMRNVHAFAMDEWADQDGNVAPISYGASLGGCFLREFYLQFREDLRPRLDQMHYYTNENIGHYSELIDECGEGGADLIISATGWIGHTAFVDPHTKKFAADSLEEFMDLPAGFVDNHRLTIVQNSGGFGSGDMYHTPRYSVSIGPRDVMHARDHLERHDLGYCGGYSSWERMVSRLQLYGPVCMEIPASLYQLTKGTIYVSEDMARPIEPMDLIAF